MAKIKTNLKGRFILLTRGSPLALVQAKRVQNTCQHYFPGLYFEIKVVKTTGDKLQKASLAHVNEVLPTSKGLFTKELEQELLSGEGVMAVHSLKDLPTDLPEGLTLGAVLRREDVRDVIIYRSEELAKGLDSQVKEWIPGMPRFRGFKPGLRLIDLPLGAVIATSSTRRGEQIRHLRPDIRIVPIRGNVGTRLNKLKLQPEIDATLLAAAGLERLDFHLFPDGHFTAPPEHRKNLEGIRGSLLSLEEMLPCVGQGAIGVEIREGDSAAEELCRAILHPNTALCVSAEREFLRAMGGGCQSPVGAYARIEGHKLCLEVVSFRGNTPQRLVLTGKLSESEALGREAAQRILEAEECYKNENS